jgi:hypothetical protein
VGCEALCATLLLYPFHAISAWKHNAKPIGKTFRAQFSVSGPHREIEGRQQFCKLVAVKIGYYKSSFDLHLGSTNLLILNAPQQISTALHSDFSP